MNPTPTVTDITTYDDDDGYAAAIQIATAELEKGNQVQLTRHCHDSTTIEWRVHSVEPAPDWIKKNPDKVERLNK